MRHGLQGRSGACGAGWRSINLNSRWARRRIEEGWVTAVETRDERFLGIDASKTRVDTHVGPTARRLAAPPTPKGLSALVARLVAIRPNPALKRFYMLLGLTTRLRGRRALQE